MLIGCGGFKGSPSEHGSVEIGYSILPEYRGRNYAPEATASLIEWAFLHPGVRRIVAKTDPDNHASIRVLEKLRFPPPQRGRPPRALRFAMTGHQWQGTRDEKASA